MLKEPLKTYTCALCDTVNESICVTVKYCANCRKIFSSMAFSKFIKTSSGFLLPRKLALQFKAMIQQVAPKYIESIPAQIWSDTQWAHLPWDYTKPLMKAYIKCKQEGKL